MKWGRVASPEAVSGDVLKTTSREGSATRALLTVRRPANPVTSEPVELRAPVKGEPVSRDSGNCEVPLVREVCVVVTEAELTVAKPGLLSTGSEVGLAGGTGVPLNCRLEPFSAALSCVSTVLGLCEKSIPTTVSLGSGVTLFESGSTFGSYTT